MATQTNNTLSNIQGGANIAGAATQVAGGLAQIIGGITFGKQELSSSQNANELSLLQNYELAKRAQSDIVNNQNLNTIVGAMEAKSVQNTPQNIKNNKWIVPVVVTLGVLSLFTVTLVVLKKKKKI